MSWGSLGRPVLYDLVQGDLDLLRASGGDFAGSLDTCLADNTSLLSASHAASPPGQNLWFLVRPVRGSLSGTYDTLQPSQDETRDPEIGASSVACP